MSSYSLYEDSEGAASPASSLASITSLGSSPAPSPSSPSSSPAPQHHQPPPPPPSQQNTYSYRTVYEQRLQPLYSARSITEDTRPMPTATHHSHLNPALQEKFNTAVQGSNYTDIEQLLRAHSHVININQYDSAGQTPLHKFIVAGDLNLIQLMVQHGADTTICSRDGWSTLHMAAWSGQPEVMMYVMSCGKR